jgi:hypothetical protein
MESGLDSHIFGEVSQSLAAKKLGRSLFSGRPGPSLCEWKAIQSQFIWCAGLSCLSLSSNNQLHKRDRPTRPEGPDHQAAPRNVAWHLFFPADRWEITTSILSQTFFFYFPQLRGPRSLRPRVRHADQTQPGLAHRTTSAYGVLVPPSSLGRPGERRSRAASPSTA